MDTQTLTFIQVTDKAEEVMLFGRKHHWRFRILTEFQGVIERPVINSKGDWVYISKRKVDEVIIPKAALSRHAAIEKAGYKVAQVIIGHEIQVAPEITKPKNIDTPIAVPKPSREIDWKNVTEIASKGVLVGILGIAMISLYALTGVLQLVDPSYVVVLDDGIGTWVELMRWNSDA